MTAHTPLDADDFLAARLDEAEAAARRATPGEWKLWGTTVQADTRVTGFVEDATAVAETYSTDPQGRPRTYDATHIARNDPAHVLRQIAAQREVIRLYRGWHYGTLPTHPDTHVPHIDYWQAPMEGVVRALASAYSTHPDYNPDWTPAP